MSATGRVRRPFQGSAARLRWIALALCAAVAGGSLGRARAADRFDPLRAWIGTELERQGVPSLAVAVARDGRILWEQGFGWADRERAVPATPHTRYSIASVSKPITATALMVLVERGLVDLDRPVNAYLGDSPVRIRVGDAAAATVRRVANHTAGLPLHHHFFVEGMRHPPAMEETIRQYANIVDPPGERYRYSNLGYGVLEYLIARTAARRYAEFMRDEIFGPLGMRRTTVGIPPGERDDYAVRYTRDGRPLPYYDFDHRGASAVFSSAHDLALFGLFHAGRPAPGTPSLLSRTAVAQMQRPTAERDDGTGYGIGWQTSSVEAGYRTVLHTGGMPGVSAWLTVVPPAGLVVVALANAPTPLPQHVTERVLATLIPVNRFATAGAGAGRADDGRRTPGRGLVGTWTGHVDAGDRQIPMRLRVETRGEVLLHLDGQPARALIARRFEGSTLRGLAHGVQLRTADASAASHALQLVLTRRGETLSGVVTAVAPSSDSIGFALSQWAELRRAVEPAAAAR